MKNKKGFVLSTYIYMLLVFFLLLLGTMLAVLNNTKLLSDKLKEQSNNSSKLNSKNISFILYGDKDMVISKGEEFIDPGFKSQTLNGEDISSNVEVTGEVNSDVFGEYKVTYKLTFNGVTKEITRNVMVKEKITDYIKKIEENEETKESNGLTRDNTAYENIRYSGSNEVVKNYVEFGNTNEIWRIIGVFDMKTSKGKKEQLVKLIREDSIGYIPWDISDSTINEGFGINQWGASTYSNGSVYEGADLMRLLNGKYLKKEDAENLCYNWETLEYGTCNFSSIGMSSIYKNMIENVVWNTGAINFDDPLISDPNTKVLNPVNWYNAERGNEGKICNATNNDDSENTLCNDTVIRTSTWNGLVALPYVTDWSYASSETICKSNIQDGIDMENNNYENATCKKNNWMHYGSLMEENQVTLMLSPVAFSDMAHFATGILGPGVPGEVFIDLAYRTRPTIYLKSNVSIISGDGSSETPYKLSL